MRMLFDRIAVIPIDDPDQSPGGIIITEDSKQRVDQGVVKYIGPEVMDVRVGDHVCFSGYSGTKITDDKEGILIIMQEEGVDAILEGDPHPCFALQTIINVGDRVRGERPQDDAGAFWTELVEQLRRYYISYGLEF